MEKKKKQNEEQKNSRKNISEFQNFHIEFYR